MAGGSGSDRFGRFVFAYYTAFGNIPLPVPKYAIMLLDTGAILGDALRYRADAGRWSEIWAIYRLSARRWSEILPDQYTMGNIGVVVLQGIIYRIWSREVRNKSVDVYNRKRSHGTDLRDQIPSAG